ncbi:MAG TPA: hypothetical protein VJC17_04385 [Candidatus Dojkabacteria bacterium]|nr:hypothetical protein [Candidatus Dojkabacteria bacterium]
MTGRNIYISGPDGTRKTQTAYGIAKWLNQEFGFPTKVVHFPTEESLPSGIIRMDMSEPPRIKLGAGARDLLFVADRTETMVRVLTPARIEKPNLWLIFDRGPFDGLVYAEAADQLRPTPIGISTGWIEACDEPFLRKFPVDLGIYLTASLEESQLIMVERGRLEGNDMNVALQSIVRTVFDKYFTGKLNWTRVEVGRYPYENLVNQAARILSIIKVILRDRMIGWGIEGRFSSPET